ncbi:uncharacterized protein LOC122250652 [Penaeus japonicus]|uniref:uncharacterized protein LOC122250652 n=1 Tax=Penaeus japonicus TaxID=27405 RepID=UPI001C70B000|nr:uncharacterized protein LOC122250652 [Penaeus japonicus]
MTSSIISDELSRKIADMISKQNDWTEEDKTRILSEYMKTFGEVWKEAVNIFNNGNMTSQSESADDKDKEEAKIVETAEDLEETEIRHEGTLIAVTKKRKEYPAKIAALLGKTTRLQKNTVEVLKVDLPPRPPLELDNNTSHLNTNLSSMLEASSCALSENMKNLQPHNHRLTHLAEAMDILTSNRNNPMEVLLTNKK